MTKETFFYTTDTPNHWSSGPVIHTLVPPRFYDKIESLEQAEALAKSVAGGYPGSENYVETSWGVMYTEERKES